MLSAVILGSASFGIAAWFAQSNEPNLISEGSYNYLLTNKPVKIYTTSWCPYCKQLRAYLNNHSIPFEEEDIEASELALQEYNQLNGQMIPLLITEKLKLQGFEPALLDRFILPTFNTAKEGVK